MDRELIENEQFKLFVESAEKMSEKRMINNNFVLTLNTAYIGFLVTIDKKILILYILGIILCVVWLIMNFNYRERNKIKFEIINEYESKHNQFYIKEYAKTKKMLNLNFFENVIIFIFVIVYILTYIFDLV